jgi:hypothetical protein
MTAYEKERQAHPKPVSMTISSRAPSKWRFVDLETGHIWKYENGRFTADGRGEHRSEHIIVRIRITQV